MPGDESCVRGWLIFISPSSIRLQVNVSKVWLTVSSVLLAFSFIFSAAISNTFESVIFLFVVHPFDVGDVLLLVDLSNIASGAQYCQVRWIFNPSIERIGLASFRLWQFLNERNHMFLLYHTIG